MKSVLNLILELRVTILQISKYPFCCYGAIAIPIGVVTKTHTFDFKDVQA